MPRLSAWTVRTALVYFGVGFTLGALMLLNKGLPIDPRLWRLLPLHIEFLMFGWTLQLAMGVAFWILPRFSGGDRGDVRLAWAAFVLLNAGVLCVSAAQWIGGAESMLVGRVAELLAAIAFALHAWPRIKPPGA